MKSNNKKVSKRLQNNRWILPSLGILIVLAVILAVAWRGADAVTVKKGDHIAVNYVGTLEDGTIFDTSIEEQAKKGGVYSEYRDYEPLEFTVGAGQMIKGFDQGVIGMKVGETKRVKIPAKEAYGEHDPSLIQEISTKVLLQAAAGANVTEIKVGDSFFMTGPYGRREAKVVSTNDTTTRFDLNHPLAGKTLIFDITLVEIKK
jgi:FKBP-type peptidyl-prolyl cis-trans isomerase 2